VTGRISSAGASWWAANSNRCPPTPTPTPSRARLSYRRAAELFTEATAASDGGPWALHQVGWAAFRRELGDPSGFGFGGRDQLDEPGAVVGRELRARNADADRRDDTTGRGRVRPPGQRVLGHRRADHWRTRLTPVRGPFDATRYCRPVGVADVSTLGTTRCDRAPRGRGRGRGRHRECSCPSARWGLFSRRLFEGCPHRSVAERVVKLAGEPGGGLFPECGPAALYRGPPVRGRDGTRGCRAPGSDLARA
jgi:hypothetical protein